MKYNTNVNIECMYICVYISSFDFFHVSTTQTTQPILTHDSSNDALGQGSATLADDIKP